MTGVRYQELSFSAFVLSTAIAFYDCRHSRNMRLRRAGSSSIVRRNQKLPTPRPRELAGDAKGKGTSGSNRKAESTDAPERGGLLRSSDEAADNRACPLVFGTRRT